MENIHTLRKGKQEIPTLVQEEEKERPKARIHMIPAIDRTHNVPTWKKDFTTKQGQLPSTLGKRSAEESPYASDSDMPSSVNESDIAL